MQQALGEHLESQRTLGALGVEQQVVRQEEAGRHDEGLHDRGAVLEVR